LHGPDAPGLRPPPIGSFARRRLTIAAVTVFSAAVWSAGPPQGFLHFIKADAQTRFDGLEVEAR
jgi:hypothetical protein